MNNFKDGDPILVRDDIHSIWKDRIFKMYLQDSLYPYIVYHRHLGDLQDIGYKLAIPYNEETKHLVNTILPEPDLKYEPTGCDLIYAERYRQQKEEQYTLDYDLDNHRPIELELAATCYAIPPEYRSPGIPKMWPWNAKYWKPSNDRNRDLAKAGSLLAAAIDLRKELKRRHSEIL